MSAMITVRLRFEKTGRAVYISHLDLTRTMTRALRRARLPVWYTEGFHRHPYLTFAAPLSLGTEGLDECMDFRTEQPLAAREWRDRLNAVLPDGLSIHNAALAVMKPSEITAARYRLSFSPVHAEAVSHLLAAEEIVVEKRTKKGGNKTLDIRPLMTDIAWDSANGILELTLPLGALSVNPALFVHAVGEGVFCRITRMLILSHGEIFH